MTRRRSDTRMTAATTLRRVIACVSHKGKVISRLGCGHTVVGLRTMAAGELVNCKLCAKDKAREDV